MLSKRRIAMVIAGMVIGAPIGIASVAGLQPGEPPQEISAQTEATEPTLTEQSPVESATPEQASVPEQSQPADAGYVIPERPRTLTDVTFPELKSDVFPPSTDDRPLLPSVIAYLDRKAANTLLADAGSREPVFARDEERMPPSQLAYFEAREAAQLAAAQARAVAERVVTPGERPAETPNAAAVDPGVDQVAGNVQQ